MQTLIPLHWKPRPVKELIKTMVKTLALLECVLYPQSVSNAAQEDFQDVADALPQTHKLWKR